MPPLGIDVFGVVVLPWPVPAARPPEELSPVADERVASPAFFSRLS